MALSPLDIAISALEKEVSRLEYSVDGLEKWLWLFSGAVVIGVIFEFWTLFDEYRTSRNEWVDGSIKSTQKPSIWKLLFEVTGVLLVVVGVAGELWIGVLSANRNTDLRSKSNRLTGLIREKAGNAQAAAADASRRAAKAITDNSNTERDLKDEKESSRIKQQKLTDEQKELVEQQRGLVARLERADQAAAQAAKDLETERRKRLALAANLLVGRHLCDQFGVMSKLASQPVKTKALFEFPQEREPRRLAEEIALTFNFRPLISRRGVDDDLIRDGVTISPGSLMPDTAKLFKSGRANEIAPLIEEALRREKRTEEVGKILIESLISCGVDAVAGIDGGSVPPDTVLIEIGRDSRLLSATLNELGASSPTKPTDGSTTDIPYEVEKPDTKR
jgi:hypothetical protein